MLRLTALENHRADDSYSYDPRYYLELSVLTPHRSAAKDEWRVEDPAGGIFFVEVAQDSGYLLAAANLTYFGAVQPGVVSLSDRGLVSSLGLPRLEIVSSLCRLYSHNAMTGRRIFVTEGSYTMGVTAKRGVVLETSRRSSRLIHVSNHLAIGLDDGGYLASLEFVDLCPEVVSGILRDYGEFYRA
jgi:hypothetical protein